MIEDEEPAFLEVDAWPGDLTAPDPIDRVMLLVGVFVPQHDHAVVVTSTTRTSRAVR